MKSNHSQQYKIHFSFVQSIQAVSYVQPHITSHSDVISEQSIQLLDGCFQQVFSTVMSDASIYLDSPNCIQLAWIWANLGLSSLLDPCKLKSLPVFIKNVDLFLEKQKKQTRHSSKASLFASPPKQKEEEEEEEEHIILLERIQNSLQLSNRAFYDDEFYNSSLLDHLNELKKSIQFDLGSFPGVEALHTAMTQLIQSLDKISRLELCSSITITAWEISIVEILSYFDLLVTIWKKLITSSGFLQEYHFLCVYLGVYELKLRFVEEVVIVCLTETELLDNLEKVKLFTVDSMFQLLCKHEEHLIRKGQYNIRRCLVKVTQLHLQQQNRDKLQIDLRLLTLIQHTYLSCDSVDTMIESVTHLLKQSATTPSDATYSSQESHEDEMSDPLSTGAEWDVELWNEFL